MKKGFKTGWSLGSFLVFFLPCALSWAAAVQDEDSHGLRLADPQLPLLLDEGGVTPGRSNDIEPQSPGGGLHPSDLGGSSGAPAVSISCPAVDGSSSDSTALAQNRNSLSCFYKARILSTNRTRDVAAGAVRTGLAVAAASTGVGAVVVGAVAAANAAQKLNCKVKKKERDDIDVNYLHFGWEIQDISWNYKPVLNLELQEGLNQVLQAQRAPRAGARPVLSSRLCSGSVSRADFENGNFDGACTNSRSKWVDFETTARTYKSELHQALNLTSLDSGLRFKIKFFLYCDADSRGELDGCPAQLADLAAAHGLTRAESDYGILPMESVETPDEVYVREHIVSLPKHELRGRALWEILSATGELQIAGVVVDQLGHLRADSGITPFFNGISGLFEQVKDDYKVCGMAPARAVTNPDDGKGEGFVSWTRDIGMSDGAETLMLSPIQQASVSVVKHMQNQALTRVLPRQLKGLSRHIEWTAEQLFGGSSLAEVVRWQDRGTHSVSGEPSSSYGGVSLFARASFDHVPATLTTELARNSCLVGAPSAYSGVGTAFNFDTPGNHVYAHGLNDKATSVALDLALTSSSICSSINMTTTELPCDAAGYCFPLGVGAGASVAPRSKLSFNLTQISFPSFQWKGGAALPASGTSITIMDDFIPSIPGFLGSSSYSGADKKFEGEFTIATAMEGSGAERVLVNGRFSGRPEVESLIANRRCVGWILRPSSMNWGQGWEVTLTSVDPVIDIIRPDGSLLRATAPRMGTLDLRLLQSVITSRLLAKFTRGMSPRIPLTPGRKIDSATTTTGDGFARVAQGISPIMAHRFVDCDRDGLVPPEIDIPSVDGPGETPRPGTGVLE